MIERTDMERLEHGLIDGIPKLWIYGPGMICKPTAEVTDYSYVPRLKEIMLKALEEFSGVGLAGPQIGFFQKVFVMQLPGSQPLICCNPVITRRDGKQISQEGCLSIPHHRAGIERAAEIDFRFNCETGELVCFDNITDLGALCVQHEIDHLEGKFFVDYLSNLKRSIIADSLAKDKHVYFRNAKATRNVDPVKKAEYLQKFKYVHFS
jgi:peptide deformylase